MDKEKLDNVIAQHAQWLRSGGASGRQADFEDADLRQADLRGVDLSFATFTGANLERAEMAGAVLCNAILRRVAMSFASLSGADLTGADLQQAVAEGADLTSARLNGAIMLAARMDHACLRLADLTDAAAAKASFRRCDFSYARLARANLGDANLSHANLAGTELGDSAERLFAATQSDQTGAGDADELEYEARVLAAQRRQLRRDLRRMSALQRAAFWLTLAGVVGCIAAGATDLGLVLWYRSFDAVMGFNYLVPLVMSLVGGAMFTVLLFGRLKAVSLLRRISHAS